MTWASFSWRPLFCSVLKTHPPIVSSLSNPDLWTNFPVAPNALGSWMSLDDRDGPGTQWVRMRRRQSAPGYSGLHVFALSGEITEHEPEMNHSRPLTTVHISVTLNCSSLDWSLPTALETLRPPGLTDRLFIFLHVLTFFSSCSLCFITYNQWLWSWA